MAGIRLDDFGRCIDLESSDYFAGWSDSAKAMAIKERIRVDEPNVLFLIGAIHRVGDLRELAIETPDKVVEL